MWEDGSREAPSYPIGFLLFLALYQNSPTYPHGELTLKIFGV